MNFKIIGIGMIVIIVLVIILLVLIGNYFYNVAINSGASKEILDRSKHLGQSDMSGNPVRDEEERQEALKWGESVYSILNIRSFDNLNLNGYYFENSKSNHKYVIVVHGYMCKAMDMISSIKKFYEEGYSVLAPDCRGQGNSEGHYIGMGWFDRFDILRWISLIIKKDSDARIALYGVSMGGATVMMTSGEDLPSNVKVIVEDCGYTCAKDIFTYQLKDLYNLNKFPIIPVTSIITKIRAGYFLGEASTIKQVAKSKTPIYFIHGDIDKFVPFSMLDEVYNAASCPKDKMIVAGAGHGFAASVDGEIYWKKVFNFIEKYMSR